MFVFGFQLAGRPALWLMIARLRWPALLLALLGTAGFIASSLGASQAFAPCEWQR